MSNMSYCRFQNTLRDLRDCEDAIHAVVEEGEELSAEELDAAVKLIQLAEQIVLNTRDYLRAGRSDDAVLEKAELVGFLTGEL